MYLPIHLILRIFASLGHLFKFWSINGLWTTSHCCRASESLPILAGWWPSSHYPYLQSLSSSHCFHHPPARA